MTTVAGIVQKIQYAIMTGEFMPRQRLVESELALTYSLGRSVIRESLRILEDRGAVISHSNKGASVAISLPGRSGISISCAPGWNGWPASWPSTASRETTSGRWNACRSSCGNRKRRTSKRSGSTKPFTRSFSNPRATTYSPWRSAPSFFFPVLSAIAPTFPRPSRHHHRQHDEIINSLKNGQKQLFLDLTHSHVFESLKAYLFTFTPPRPNT